MTLTNSLTKLAAAVAAASLVVGFAFMVVAPRAEAASLTPSQVSSIISLLQSFGADSATIANVQASLNGTTPTVPSTPSTPSACGFTRDLTLGAKGADVTCLQQTLISKGYSIAAGATGLFGPQTQAAVIAWQKAAGVTPAAGYFGAKSRAAFGGSTSTGPTTPVPTGTGLSVMAGTQPANGLSPQGATRVPFTRFTLTAGNDGDVAVTSVQVQRTGFGQDAAFAGIVLIDEDTGQQLGVARTFNSNHQAAIGQPMTIARGTTKHFLVGGNMNTSLLSYAGEAPSISVVGVNTAATVTGTLPIVGAYNTNNATLTVGSVTITASNAFASNSNQTKEIGTTAFKQSGFRLQAGSSEDVRFLGMRWNMTGSVSASDLANVKTVVNGTAYPTMLSADGKYFDTNFGSGLVIAKGNQVDVYVQYDIVGANSSGRTVQFDVDKNTDIFLKGETYGFGISPTNTNGTGSTRGTYVAGSTATPYVFSTTITVSGASVTSIAKANEVPAQNIAINLPNQPLGGYVVDIKGENLTVQSTAFTIASTTGSGTGLLTSLTLVDENGAVVAGPVDAVYTSSLVQTATFTDTITYKTGRHVYTLRGKVASNIGNGGTYTATTDPSTWGNPKGESTGNTISLSANTSFSMNAMTVKSGALSISPASSPASQTIVPGGSSLLMANIQLDASQSGEDVRLATIPARLTLAGTANNSNQLTSCQIFDGATALNTGSNTVNPTATVGPATVDNTFTLDNPVTVVKGTVKTLGVRCNVSGSATSGGSFAWTPGAAAFITNFTVTGAVSGTTITATNGSGSGAVFTIGAGSVTVTTDASSPSYTIASAASTGVAGGAFKFRASNENVTLTKLGLTLSNSASSSSGDLVKVSIFDGATKVGEAFFSGANTTATSTLTTPVTLARDTDKTLTVQLDLADVGSSQAVTFSGHLVAVNYLNAEATGVSSGSTFLLGTSAGSTAVAGVRVYKSFPTFSLDTLPSTGVADGRLLRFKVTADAKGPVGITQFVVNLATSTGVGVSNLTIYGFTDTGYSTPISGVSSNGDLQSTDDCLSSSCTTGVNATIGVTTSSGTPTVIQIPSGQTRYFEVRGSVSGIVSGSSITATVKGDSAFITSTGTGATVNPLSSTTGAVAAANLIWSPNSTTTAVRADQDWSSGFGVLGLPSGGLIQTRSN